MEKQEILTKHLGVGGIEVPAIGIGTWAWGDRLFWGYGDRYGEAEVEAAFEAAIATGLTFFDTAEVYGMGESERLLGRFMAGVEQSVTIATKYGALPWRLTPDAVSSAVSQSLARLQTDQIPLYQVHWPFHWFVKAEQLFAALAIEVEQGRIQAVGVSNYSATQMKQAHGILADHGVPLAVNQVRYSLITRGIERNGILEMARQLGVAILAYSPLAQGLLTGKYTAEHRPTGARKLDSRFSQRGLEKLAPVITLLSQLAERHNRTMAQVALNWLVNQDGVIPIPGVKTAAQVQDNAGALGWSLSPQELVELDRVSAPS